MRALEAYDEALKVRKRETMPIEYANTIANKANCLWNLPDCPEYPDLENRESLLRARDHYRESREIFSRHGEVEKARVVAEACEQIDRQLLALSPANGSGRRGALQ